MVPAIFLVGYVSVFRDGMSLITTIVTKLELIKFYPLFKVWSAVSVQRESSRKSSMCVSCEVHNIPGNEIKFWLPFAVKLHMYVLSIYAFRRDLFNRYRLLQLYLNLIPSVGLANRQVCSGRGTCECGVCICDRPNSDIVPAGVSVYQ